MVDIGGELFKISDDGKSILRYNSSNKMWNVTDTAPQGKSFKKIRESPCGHRPEYKCDDDQWYEKRTGGGLRPIDRESKKTDDGSQSKRGSKKKGSLAWRIIKGTFKVCFGLLAFCIGYQSGKEE